MKLTNLISGRQGRIVTVAADRRERPSSMIVIVPRVFMQPTFVVPIIHTSRELYRETSPAEEEALAAVEPFVPDTGAA